MTGRLDRERELPRSVVSTTVEATTGQGPTDNSERVSDLKGLKRCEEYGNEDAGGVHRFPGPTSGDTPPPRGPDGRFVAAHSEEARFWRRVDTAHPSGCWPWTGRRNADGYGVFKTKREGDGSWTEIRAHRWAWEHTHGPTPLPLDHLCHTNDPTCRPGACPHRACVNPVHLEEVSTRENRRRVHARTTDQEKNPT